MRNTLPKLIAGLLLFASGVSATFAQEVPTLDGQQMIAHAAAQMGTYEALQCRIRQRVRLFGQELNGHGTYQQARIDGQLRLRLELKLPIGDQATHLQQINDGEYLWIRRAVLDDGRLSVIDVGRVREASTADPRRFQSALAIGGISQLLFGLHASFEFEKPRAGRLGKEPVWIVEGIWKDEAKAGEGGDPQIPSSVLVVLSRDELLPLFPFRIEYYREQESADREAVMTLEFFEVGMLRNVDARNFTYSAGEQEIVDETDTYLSRF
jgi:hypothetical protein